MNDKLIIGKMLMDYGLVAWYHQKKKNIFRDKQFLTEWPHGP